MGDNALEGELPLSISQLTKLRKSIWESEWLSLGFEFLIVFSSAFVSSLLVDSLRLENNKLVGTLHPEMASMKLLGLMYLGNNMLEGSIPDMFQGMGKLSELQAKTLSTHSIAFFW